jgi:hypothetical protein|tara:strand:+ start:13550 stop:13996 length:447 start_codon:yes stop_codon:yes gene_type:complete
MAEAFTSEDIKQGEAHPELGPEYFAARRIAEGVADRIGVDAFKGMIDKFTDDFRDRLWSDIADYLVTDTEMNVQGAVRSMVEGTVRALLTGEQWAMNRYPYCDYRDGEKIRKRIAEHSGDEIARRRIADLEREVAGLNDRISYMRGTY